MKRTSGGEEEEEETFGPRKRYTFVGNKILLSFHSFPLFFISSFHSNPVPSSSLIFTNCVTLAADVFSLEWNQTDKKRVVK